MTEPSSGDQPAQVNDEASDEQSERPKNEPAGTAPDRPGPPENEPAGTAPDRPGPPENEPAGTAPDRPGPPENEPAGTAPDRPGPPENEPAGTAPDRPGPPENEPAGTAPDRPEPRESASGRGHRPPERRPGGHAPPAGRQQNPSERRRDDESSKEKMLRYLYWGSFGLLFLFGAAAAVSLYFSVMDIIDIWVAADFKPVFRMLFDLAVVLVTVLGLSVLIRRFDIVFDSSEDS